MVCGVGHACPYNHLRPDCPLSHSAHAYWGHTMHHCLKSWLLSERCTIDVPSCLKLSSDTFTYYIYIHNRTQTSISSHPCNASWSTFKYNFRNFCCFAFLVSKATDIYRMQDNSLWFPRESHFPRLKVCLHAHWWCPTIPTQYCGNISQKMQHVCM